MGGVGASSKPSLRASHGAGWVASHAGVLVALSFGVGVAAGGAATALLRKPPERIVYVDRPAIVAPSAPAAPAPPFVPSGDVDPSPAVSARLPRVRLVPIPSSRVIPTLAAASSLPAERLLLDDARNALSQNDGARALVLTDEHARRFAHPQLREEREAIAIQALVIERRYDEARERARQFRAASPDSLFLPAVEASLASIP